MQKTICITGCSSGIGAAMAQEFHRRGHIVYATARRIDSIAALSEQGIRTLRLDVNDDDSIAAAFAIIAKEQGRIDVLVNNAGFSQLGAVIDLTREDLRKQYETNVIAPMAIIKAAINLLRATPKLTGRNAVIANVGSIVGLVATPFSGAYCSSKAAIHSLSDALRLELAPLGIHVVKIQPGSVVSSFGNHAEAAVRLPADSLYSSVADRIRGRARVTQKNAIPAEEFVRPVVNALLANKPPVIIRGGTSSIKLPLLSKLLPTAILDSKLSEFFGVDGLVER
jgi:NAD(P)-dependent dehydrogenase (short-subunit alcohol dehydrogenase family)